MQAGVGAGATVAAWARRAAGVLVLVGGGLAATRPAVAGTSLGIATPVVDPGHAGLRHWFEALRATADGRSVARALHYGDSTIVADGISRTVRDRLRERFGDAGPGFVSAGLTPTWNQRSDIVSSRRGAWEWRTILLGGAGGRYGLGGIVAILRGGSAVVKAVTAAGEPVPQKHVELWYQGGQGYGSYWVSVDGKEIGRGAAAAAATDDRRFQLDVPDGFTAVSFGNTGGALPVYGLVLETGRAGATWESLGVTGVGSKSFSTFAGEPLRTQVEQRKPDLLVVMLGGNEAGYPSLMSKGGAAYEPVYAAGLQTILAGRGEASCLVVTPLDQGFVDEEDGTAKARPGMPNMVAVQERVALNNGCAFWSTWSAMGGAGSALTWGRTRGIGAGDYVHLTPAGLERLGGLLADALLADFDAWSAGA
jgi:hypothetical protein